MTNSKTTKRTLLLSILAILVCIAMLIGVTFAWFTDSVKSDINTIQAGNLKIKVLYSTDFENWNEVNENVSVFNKNALWEPGYTEVVYLKVVNDGNLALKYSVNVSKTSVSQGENADGDSFELEDYIMFGTAQTETKYDTREAAQKAVAANAKIFGTGANVTENMLVLNPQTESKPVAMVAWMPTTVGNEANNVNKSLQPAIEFRLSVNATQATVEEDSFNNQYDKDAPTVFSPIENSEGINTVTDNIYASGLRGAVHVLGGTTTINANVTAYEDKNWKGEKYAMAVCADQSYYGAVKVIINGGTFTQEVKTENEDFSLIYAKGGAKIEIKGGTFIAAVPKWTLNCQDGEGSTITVTGGKFYKFDPSNAQVGDNEIIVPNGYHVDRDGDWYTVVAD